MASFVVMLDANAIIPAVLRDTLFRAGQARPYRIQFTDMILDEVQRNLVKNGMCDAAQTQHLIDEINTNLSRALVTKDYRSLIPGRKRLISFWFISFISIRWL